MSALVAGQMVRAVILTDVDHSSMMSAGRIVSRFAGVLNEVEGGARW
jgi:hypothetical protein